MSLQGRAEVVQELLDRGAMLTDRDNLQRTPLALAAGGGYGDCVRVLLRAGARITKEIPGNDVSKETRGRTPLLLAAARGHTEVGLSIALILHSRMVYWRAFP